MTNRRIVIYSPLRTPSLIVEQIAKYAQCEAICCTSTEQTITATLASEPFLVILLSIRPIINGSRFITRLRSACTPHTEQCGTRRATILIIAWQQTEHTILSLLEEGIDQYMTFPICANRLYGKISTLLKTYRQ
jgi:DNA-binding response OmpR family regulator